MLVPSLREETAARVRLTQRFAKSYKHLLVREAEAFQRPATSGEAHDERMIIQAVKQPAAAHCGDVVNAPHTHSTICVHLPLHEEEAS
jgi:hypothetical protein